MVFHYIIAPKWLIWLSSSKQLGQVAPEMHNRPGKVGFSLPECFSLFLRSHLLAPGSVCSSRAQAVPVSGQAHRTL